MRCMQVLKVPEVLYAGIFLDDAARDQLLSLAPAVFANVSADHLTLRFRPSTDWLRQLPLGQHVTLTSMYEAIQDGIQVRTWTLHG